MQDHALNASRLRGGALPVHLRMRRVRDERPGSPDGSSPLRRLGSTTSTVVPRAASWCADFAAIPRAGQEVSRASRSSAPEAPCRRRLRETRRRPNSRHYIATSGRCGGRKVRHLVGKQDDRLNDAERFMIQMRSLRTHPGHSSSARADPSTISANTGTDLCLLGAPCLKQ